MADHRTVKQHEQAQRDLVDGTAGEVFRGLKELQDLRGDIDALYLAAGTLKGAVAYLCDDSQEFERLVEALRHWINYVEGARKLRDTQAVSEVRH